jgi:hypothetical protein
LLSYPGFQVGVAAAWRHIRAAITLLAATANDLHQAMTRIRLPACVVLDGTLIPIDRVRAGNRGCGRTPAPLPAEAVAPAEGREQGPRPDP